MFRPSLRNLFVAVAVTVGLAAQDAAAQTTPFAIAGGGVATTGLPLPGQPARTHWSVGLATHLVAYTGTGSIKTDTAVPDFAAGIITGEFGSGSPYVFTAANGDKLTTYYGRTDKGAADPGEFKLTIVDVLPDGSLVVEAQFLAEFVVQPALSTGRYAGATGSWTMYAWTGPFVLGSSDPTPYAWVGVGSLKLRRGR